MIFPTADNIEEGLLLLQKMDPRERDAQLDELRSAQPFPITIDLEMGYLLGLATARAVIFDSAEVRRAGADPAKIL